MKTEQWNHCVPDTIRSDSSACVVGATEVVDVDGGSHHRDTRRGQGVCPASHVRLQIAPAQPRCCAPVLMETSISSHFGKPLPKPTEQAKTEPPGCTLYSWGWNRSAGSTPLHHIGEFVDVASVGGVWPPLCKAVHVGACVITFDRGVSSNGQLGCFDHVAKAAPFGIRFAVSVKIVKVATGSRFSAAVDTHGRLWTWGV